MSTTNLDQTKAQALASMLATVLREWLTDAEFQEMRQMNTTEDYSGDCCASHDFCDANMAMDEAFRRVFGRSCTLPSDVEENPALEGQQDVDMGYWNAAWGHARAERLI